MDNKRTILTIQVFQDDNNEFKISSSENIIYDQLKQITLEKFKVSEREITYFSFSYKDNEGMVNYINEDDVLIKLAEETSPGNLLLKLNFEEILYEKCNQCGDENFENEQKKLEKEIYNSKINQLNQIIKEKDEEILKLSKEALKLNNSSKINDQIFYKEKKNETLDFKNLNLKNGKRNYREY